jgi:hypothetical protein
MLSKHEEQAERLEVLENEKRLRATTLSQFAQSEADIDRGRFTAHERSTVVGATPIPKYEGAPNWAHDPVPTENPLGYSINEMDTTGQPYELRASSLEPSSLSPAQGNSPNPAPPQTPLTAGLGFSSRTYRRA